MPDETQKDDETRMADEFARPDDEEGPGQGLPAPARVQLSRSAQVNTPDEALWEVIKDSTQYLSYDAFANWMDNDDFSRMAVAVDGYLGLKEATELFVRRFAHLPLNDIEAFDEDDQSETDDLYASADDRSDKDRQNIAALGPYVADYHGLKVLPYHRIILDRLQDLPLVGMPGGEEVWTTRSFRHVAQPTMVELIWSYWHEEAMLVQAMNAISRRFQNRRGPQEDDPLLRLEIHPLRPVNNLLWGWVQDEQNRLTVQRRAYEYDHHYGISLWGKAVPGIEPADSRSRFLRAFHDLLTACTSFYEADNDTTVIADAFPLLNALEDVHVILAEGAHNQFGDLPIQARAEMLMMQHVLARPEMQEFLGGRHGVPYREPWMDRVDSMRQLFGWGDASVTHFRDLAVYGERLLLSIRYGNWASTNDQASAANWARYWRPEVQSYVHSYKAVTGVDLSGAPVEAVDSRDAARYLAPSVHLRKQLTTPRRGGGVRATPIGRAAASRNGAGR